ncbi:MAG: hypothetical protein GXY42_08475 [Desulfovibrionales bacterium]|nr:hypothetical protein [Desulfovibrionales bacterium]
MNWKNAFARVPSLRTAKDGLLIPHTPLRNIDDLRTFLDFVHIKFCLLKPFQEIRNYPAVDARDLLPSFEPFLTEFPALPGFSMVALNRTLDYFNEVFQFDLLHTCRDPDQTVQGEICVLEHSLQKKNAECFLRHLPREQREAFKSDTTDIQVSDIDCYSLLIHYLSHMDRAHVLSLDRDGQYYLSGIYASLPSDLDTELKRFGIKARKFHPNDNRLYEKNREFVYQFLMELYGYPISSERKTSAAIFSRRLHKMGERFLIKVLGQSDRTITSIFSTDAGRPYPQVEKIALVPVETRGMDVVSTLERGGYFVDAKKRIVILRVVYRQHKFDANNVRQDRALSVSRQEIVHPLTGEVCTAINLIKDSYSMSLKLNDIVRGEFTGRVVFKGNEVVENTESHEKRLKFLHSWLTKHQRRMIGYSDEFYRDIVRVLDGYLNNPDVRDELSGLHDLLQEVSSNYSYIQQARKIRQIEELKDRLHKGKKISYRHMLQLTTDLMADLRFEATTYFDTLIRKAIYFSETILNDRYLIRSYIQPREDQLTDNGLQIRKLYRRLVSLVDELKAIRKTRTDA